MWAAILVGWAFAGQAQAARQLVPGVVAQKPQVAPVVSSGADPVTRELAALGFVVTAVTPQSEERAASALAASPAVRVATPVYRYAPCLRPDDPLFPLQWHHAVLGSLNGWDQAQGALNAPIAILDTGVDPTHPDLRYKLLPGFNFASGNADTADVLGHGTAVAGTAAAAGNNAEGVAGLAWQNPILPVRIAGADGFARSDVIAAAMHWAADQGARVINISFGPLQGDALVSAAARYARGRGALVFAAAGNEGVRDPTLADPSILFVAATDRNDLHATFSTSGPSISLAAPGVEIVTTGNNAQYVSASGTSFASPLAAGAAALVWSANPALSADAVEAILRTTARDLGLHGSDELFGSGRIDVAAAVRAAVASRASAVPATPPPTPTPTPAPPPSLPLPPAPPPSPSPSHPPTPAPSPPAPSLPPLTITSPGPNGLFMGGALTVAWRCTSPAQFSSIVATVDGSIRATAPRTNAGPSTTFLLPAFNGLTRGSHVLQLIGTGAHGGEARSPNVFVLRY